MRRSGTGYRWWTKSVRPLVEIPDVRQAGGQSGGAQIGVVRLATPSETLQELGADTVPAVSCCELSIASQAVDDREPGGGPTVHGYGHGAVELDDRIGVDTQQEVVQRDDLSPVGRLEVACLRMDCGDGTLELVRPDRPARQCRLDQCNPSAIRARSHRALS